MPSPNLTGIFGTKLAHGIGKSIGLYALRQPDAQRREQNQDNISKTHSASLL